MNNHLNCKCSGCDKINSNKEKDQFIKISKNELDVFICESCLKDMISEIEYEKNLSNPFDIFNKNEAHFDTNQNPFPKDVFNYLNEHVVGQDEAKKSLSIAIAQHFRRLKDPSIKKSNILLIGPTGTGKTEIARNISEFLKIPFVTTDATNLTTRGYVGEDAESIVGRLLQKTNWNVHQASQGIIFIDEIDKLAKSQNGESGVNTVAVQQELLKIIEGSVIKVKNKSGPVTEEVFINTSNILFICAGAFEGLKDLVCVEEKQIGLGIGQNQDSNKNSDQNWQQSINSSHLTKYGLIPELLGRIPVLTFTKELSVETLEKILIEPKNSILNQYKKLFELDQVSISFDKKYLKKIAFDAHSKKLGARGLKQVIENRLQNLYFKIDEYKNKEITVSENNELITETETNHSQELSLAVGS